MRSVLKVEFFRQRPLTACALGLLAGALLGIYLPWRPFLLLTAFALSVTGAVLSFRSGQGKLTAVTACFLLTGALLAGFGSHPSLPAFRGTGTVTAVVEEPLSPRAAGGYRTVLRDAVVTDETGAQTCLGRLYWTMAPSDDSQTAFAEGIRCGDRVTVTGKVYAPSPRDNPYGFDFRLYLLQRGIGLGFSGCKDGEVLQRDVPGLGLGVTRLRLAIFDAMDRVFGASAAYPKALLLGEREALSDETREQFNQLGIAHVLAVSGLHVALLAGAVLSLSERFGTRVWPRFFICAGFLLAYCILLGAPVSAVRASILFALEQGRVACRRNGDTLTVMAVALIVILLLFPLSVLSVGLWMTFGAVLGIHMVRNALDWRLRNLKGRRFAMPVLLTAGAVWGMAVPSVIAYHTFSLWGLILSPLACSFLAMLLPVYLMIFFAGIIWLPLGQLAAGILDRLIGWLPGLLARFPRASLTLPAPSVWFLIAFVTVTILLTRYTLFSPRKRLIIGASVVALCLAFSLVTADRSVKYIQFSEGQADAAVIEDRGETVLIDTGENGSDLTEYLLSVGRRPDKLLLTHLHSDHCGGVLRLLEAGLVPGEVILPFGAAEQQLDAVGVQVLAELESRKILIRYAGRGDVLETRNTRITFLWPEKGKVRPGQDPNAYSMAGLVDFGNAALLFTGDLEGAYEDYAAVPADILKVAHHGSGGSTSERFLKAVGARTLILTCESGRALPNINTLARLEDYGAAVYRTDRTGAVTIRFGADGYSVTPFLK